MLMPLLIAFLFAIVVEGVGQFILKRMCIETSGYASPVGVAVVFAVLELLYLPRFCMGGSFDWVKGSTIVIFIIAVVMLIACAKEVFHTVFRKNTIYVGLSGILFFCLIHICLNQIPYLSDLELLTMEENFVTGTVSLTKELQLQGYPLLGSYFMWMFNGDAVHVMILMSIFATVIASAFILNVIDGFAIENRWFRFTLIVCAIFYGQFYSWKITGAYLGGNWRIFLIGMLLYIIYEWLRGKKEQLKYLIPIVIGAGLFSHHGFLMIGIEVLYLLGVYLFYIRKIRTLFDLITFFLPVVVYLCAWAGICGYGVWGWIGVIGYGLFCLLRYRQCTYHRIVGVDNFLADHAYQLFGIAIPVIFLVGSFVLRFFVPGHGIYYSKYIDYLSNQVIRSYLFIGSTWLDIVLDVFRWVGTIFFLFKAKETQEKAIRIIMLGMVVFFVNPLCMGMLQEITGMETYAYAFEILFNPFTDLLIFYWIYRQFEWTVVGQWVLELSLIFCALFGHVSSFMKLNTGLYTNLLEEDFNIKEVILP